MLQILQLIDKKYTMMYHELMTHLPLWEVSGPTEDGLDAFTLGDCWVLAWAIAQKLPEGRILAMGNSETYWWGHVVVEVGENRYLDIHGISSEQELFARWGSSAVTEFWEVEDLASFESYQEELGIFAFSYIESLHDADVVAEELLALHVGHQLELFALSA